ncbi:MAG: class I SAM-dependent methyltransferase [Nitrospira sp.]|nr:class I SAM-dependent methyltransferase [Nitrospira sp.]
MATMATSIPKDPDALPQLIGEFKPADEWQAHITQIFYGLKADRIRDYYQTFATADYRLAHALAADYFEKAVKRQARRESPPNTQHPSRLTIMEWGPGNGNLAACFLSHLKKLDQGGLVYPLVRYVLVDSQPAMLEAAGNHPDLAAHKDRVETLCASVAELATVKDGTVDRILCNELWNDLPTKLMLRKGGEVEEEYLRPNLSETAHAAIADWSGFVKAFEAKDLQALKEFPFSLEDIVWEREYRKTDWQPVPYRKTISEFLKQIDEEVLVPVNLGAFATMKEAKRVLAPDAVGFSSFDAGTADLALLNDPEKPCYGQFGGQFSFMVNFALIESVAKYQGIGATVIEPQKEFVGRSLGTDVISLMDLLAAYPSAGRLKPWEQDRLILKTMRVLNDAYRSPYARTIEFPLRNEMPPEEREELQGIVLSLKRDGVPDTIAYLSEEEVFGVLRELEGLGYDPDVIRGAFRIEPQSVDYYHLRFDPSPSPKK